MFDSRTRDELRQTYSEAWRKHLAGLPLTQLEAMIAEVVALHAEYQPMIHDARVAVAFEPNATHTDQNPFLHMGLHMAVREQVAIDRPPGVRDLHRRSQVRVGDLHGGEHILMDALAETLWEAQRSGRPPDEVHYLALVRRRLDLTDLT